MAEYDANEQSDLQELEGGIEQNISDSTSAAKDIYKAQKRFRDNHHSNADEAEDAEPARHGKESDKTLNQNSGQQKKPPSGKAKPKNQQKKSLKDKKSAEASAAKKSSSSEKRAQKAVGDHHRYFRRDVGSRCLYSFDRRDFDLHHLRCRRIRRFHKQQRGRRRRFSGRQRNLYRAVEGRNQQRRSEILRRDERRRSGGLVRDLRRLVDQAGGETAAIRPGLEIL